MTDRGQILLIAAVALAVTFVSLAVVVNSAIFTGNFATRGETTGASDALTYRHEIADGAESLAIEVNEENTSDLVEIVDASLGNVSAQGGLQNARRARVVTVNLDKSGTVVSARIEGNQTDDPYTNVSGDSDWTLATDGDRVAKGEFRVNGNLATSEGDALYVYINESGGSDFWRLAIFEATVPAFDYNMTVRDETGLRTECNFLATTPYTINLTAGEIRNTGTADDCASELDDSERTYTDYSPKNVSFGNADEVDGDYNVTVETNGSTPGVDEKNFNDTSPTVTVRIDVLDIVYEYESPSLHYNTTISIRPGESG